LAGRAPLAPHAASERCSTRAHAAVPACCSLPRPAAAQSPAAAPEWLPLRALQEGLGFMSAGAEGLQRGLGIASAYQGYYKSVGVRDQLRTSAHTWRGPATRDHNIKEEQRWRVPWPRRRPSGLPPVHAGCARLLCAGPGPGAPLSRHTPCRRLSGMRCGEVLGVQIFFLTAPGTFSLCSESHTSGRNRAPSCPVRILAAISCKNRGTVNRLLQNACMQLGGTETQP